MASFLETILEEKHREVADLKKNGLPPAVEECGPARRDFAAALQRENGVSLIGEIKFASPSAGRLRVPDDPSRIAKAYASAGAAALSVLTDRRHFLGDIAFVPRVKAAVDLPVLRKDFIIDPLQVQETACWGADALLLIARVLPTGQLAALLSAAEGFGLTAVVEVHGPEDVEKAVRCGARTIAVNNRDLRTFQVDLSRTIEIRPLLPPGCTAISASGIQSPGDVRRMAAAGVDAVLVGTALMADGDPAGRAGALVEAGRGEGSGCGRR